MPIRSLWRSALLVLVAGLAAAGVAVAAAPSAGPATVGARAARAAVEFGDVAVVYRLGGVDAEIASRSEQVAAAVGGWSTPGRSGTLHVRQVARPGNTVYAPPDGYTFPMVFAAFTPETLGWLLGFEVAALASPTGNPSAVVLNAATAALTGAEVGDTIAVETRLGTVAGLTVAGIVPEDWLGGTELVMTTELADRLGETRTTRTLIWGFSDRGELDRAVAASGLERQTDTEVARSWDLPDPDSVLNTLDIKRRLGTPWYQVTDGGNGVTMHPAWRSANLAPGRELLNDQIPVRARCHLTILPDLRAALADVAAAGLGGAIEVDNANMYGGCYSPRFARESWNLSRHSYGVAFDTNTVSNCAGCVPTMHCDVVRIFRRHNFAWGGNFNRPDGMHFEWVAERRDQLAYPSAYCPNPVSASHPAGSADPAEIGRAVLDVGLQPTP